MKTRTADILHSADWAPPKPGVLWVRWVKCLPRQYRLMAMPGNEFVDDAE